MLLSLKDIRVNYGTAEVIKGITLEVSEGSVVSIIGANGAGKSTILKAISGLKTLTQGEVRFLDKRIDKMKKHQIPRLGLIQVPEDRGLWPYMSVLSNLRLGAFLQKDKKEIRKELDNVFQRFPRLWERRNQQAGTLSGGEQQMLAFGRALMAKPKLLLMDEPSLGLAPIVIDEIVDVIKSINENGISVLLVEQNAGMVTRVADKSYVLEVGNIVLEGNIAELMANDAVRKAFLGA
ncbi:MAG: ABC transporter ATP-binding protein [Thermodesulfobacteriota bacterium]|jgi:branched-chain amino acid transport system ATP-binding protein